MLCIFVVSVSTLAFTGEVEEFVVAEGSRFGEQPLVAGNVVIWQAYGNRQTPDIIQLRDISRLDSPTINVAPYPASSVGVLVNRKFIFRGAGDGFGDGSPVLARPLNSFSEGKAEDLFVSDFGRAVAENREFVFLKVSSYERQPFNSKFFAKAVVDFANHSPDTLKLITSFKEETLLSRTEAASEKYFVWQDLDASVKEDTWKIYAKRAEELFMPGSERLVLDSKMRSLGVYLALHDNLLVTQAAEDKSTDSPIGLYLIDLDSTKEPARIATPKSSDFNLQWPSISKEYVVWAELSNFFERRAIALRLVDGIPTGEPLVISSGTAGGSWITIDRNIAVWNGATSFNGGDVVHQGVIAAELPLPGADDVGDVDQDGRITLTDAVLILNHLFRGGWKPRLRLADTDGNGAIELSDALVILKYLFLG